MLWLWTAILSQLATWYCGHPSQIPHPRCYNHIYKSSWFEELTSARSLSQRYRRGLLLGGICVLLTNGIAVRYPLVLRKANRRSRSYRRHQRKTPVLRIADYRVFIAKGIFQFLTRWIVIGISRDIEFDLRNDLFAHLNDSPTPTISVTVRRHQWQGDERPERRSQPSRSGDHVFGQHHRLTAFALFYMLRISPS